MKSIDSKILTGEELKQHDLKLSYEFRGNYIYSKGNENYVLIKLLARRDAYLVVNYFETNSYSTTGDSEGRG